MSKAQGKKQRKIFLDQPVKMTLLFFHFLGFAGWYGAVAMGVKVPALFPAMTTISGLLLTVRELYKDGLVWLIVTEGYLTTLKVLLLIIAWYFKEFEFFLFHLVILFGILSSHLPEKIREKRFFLNGGKIAQ